MEADNSRLGCVFWAGDTAVGCSTGSEGIVHCSARAEIESSGSSKVVGVMDFGAIEQMEGDIKPTKGKSISSKRTWRKI